MRTIPRGGGPGSNPSTGYGYRQLPLPGSPTLPCFLRRASVVRFGISNACDQDLSSAVATQLTEFIQAAGQKQSIPLEGIRKLLDSAHKCGTNLTVKVITQLVHCYLSIDLSASCKSPLQWTLQESAYIAELVKIALAEMIKICTTLPSTKSIQRVKAVDKLKSLWCAARKHKQIIVRVGEFEELICDHLFRCQNVNQVTEFLSMLGQNDDSVEQLSQSVNVQNVIVPRLIKRHFIQQKPNWNVIRVLSESFTCNIGEIVNAMFQQYAGANDIARQERLTNNVLCTPQTADFATIKQQLGEYNLSIGIDVRNMHRERSMPSLSLMRTATTLRARLPRRSVAVITTASSTASESYLVSAEEIETVNRKYPQSTEVSRVAEKFQPISRDVRNIVAKMRRSAKWLHDNQNTIPLKTQSEIISAICTIDKQLLIKPEIQSTDSNSPYEPIFSSTELHQLNQVMQIVVSQLINKYEWDSAIKLIEILHDHPIWSLDVKQVKRQFSSVLRKGIIAGNVVEDNIKQRSKIIATNELIYDIYTKVIKQYITALIQSALQSQNPTVDLARVVGVCINSKIATFCTNIHLLRNKFCNSNTAAMPQIQYTMQQLFLEIMQSIWDELLVTHSTDATTLPIQQFVKIIVENKKIDHYFAIPLINAIEAIMQNNQRLLPSSLRCVSLAISKKIKLNGDAQLLRLCTMRLTDISEVNDINILMQQSMIVLGVANLFADCKSRELYDQFDRSVAEFVRKDILVSSYLPSVPNRSVAEFVRKDIPVGQVGTQNAQQILEVIKCIEDLLLYLQRQMQYLRPYSTLLKIFPKLCAQVNKVIEVILLMPQLQKLPQNGDMAIALIVQNIQKLINQISVAGSARNAVRARHGE